MKDRLKLIGLTVMMLIAFDLIAASGLFVAGKLGGPLTKLTEYFEYGRSIPGKHQKWEQDPQMRGNLYDVAWPADIIRDSERQFAEQETNAPAIRAYGMSFLNDIMRAAKKQRPALYIDRHAGPSATPNFVYSLYQDDIANRNQGDIVVLGILSSSLAPMTTFSNSSWLFEQPAPFSYPLYTAKDGVLTRIDPIVSTPAQHRSLSTDRPLREAWRKQRREHDAYYSSISHAARWADHSPFLRLVRRYAATYHISKTEEALLGTGNRKKAQFDYADLFGAIFKDFARATEAEGTLPVVVLIQTRGNYPDLKSALAPVLEEAGIPYIATTDLYDIKDPSGFKPDGHYKDDPNDAFGAALLSLIDTAHKE